MDGGASAADPFRLPLPAQELTYPFGNGLVVRYGHTSRLASSAAALAGVTAEFPPSMEEPCRPLYFVVADHVRTTIAVLRAVLKDGITTQDRPPKALVIDTLQTLEVYRKQGLATNLTNFVKDIADAHGIGLYAICDMFSRSFWEMRGFQEETYFDVLALFNRVDEFTACKVVLRAGERYVEYQPASGNQLSQIQSFNHGRDVSNAITPGASEDNDDSDAASSSTVAAKRVAGSRESPTGCASSAADGAGAGGGGAALAHDNGGGAAAALPYNSHHLDGGASTIPLLTDASLARHDEEEAAARRFLPTAAGASPPPPLFPQGTDPPRPEAEARAGAGLPSRGLRGAEREGIVAASAESERPGAWPGVFSQGIVGSSSSLSSMSVSSTAVATPVPPMTAARSLGWPPTHDQPGAAAMAAVAAVGGDTDRAMAARALVALPRETLAPVVDLTGGIGGQTLAEQEEAEIQLAIALSLSQGDACRREGGGGGGSSACEASVATIEGAARTPLEDDTETDEEPGNRRQRRQPSPVGSSHEPVSTVRVATLEAMETKASSGAATIVRAGAGDSNGLAAVADLGTPESATVTAADAVGATGMAVPSREGLKEARSLWPSSRIPLAPDEARYRRLRGSDEESRSDASSGGSGSTRVSSGSTKVKKGPDPDGREEDSQRIKRRRGKSEASTEELSSTTSARCYDESTPVIAGGETGHDRALFDGSADCDVRERWKLRDDLVPGHPRVTDWIGSKGTGSVPPVALAPSSAINTNAVESRLGIKCAIPQGADDAENAMGWACGGAGPAIGGYGVHGLNGARSFSNGLASTRVGIGSSMRGGAFAPVSPLDERLGNVTTLPPTTTTMTSCAEADRSDNILSSSGERTEHHQEVFASSARGLPQPAQVFAAAGGGEKGAVSAGLPSAVDAVAGDQELMDDLETEQMWRDLEVEPGEIVESSQGGLGIGVGLEGGVAGGGAGLDGLLAAVNWERDDNDEDLLRAMEASKQSLEEEMIRRATQESQREAAEAATEATLEGSPPPPSQASSSSSLARANFGEGESHSAAMLPNGRDPRSAPLRTETAATAVADTMIGANEWQPRLGEANGASLADGAATVGSAAWQAAWEEPGEVPAFVGKGKGRCRDI